MFDDKIKKDAPHRKNGKRKNNSNQPKFAETQGLEMREAFLKSVKKRLNRMDFDENKCWTDDASKIFAKS